MCIEYRIYVNMYHVSAQGVDEHMIHVHYYIIITVQVLGYLPMLSAWSGRHWFNPQLTWLGTDSTSPKI